MPTKLAETAAELVTDALGDVLMEDLRPRYRASVAQLIDECGVRDLVEEIARFCEHVLRTNGLLIMAANHKEGNDDHFLTPQIRAECEEVSVAGQELCRRADHFPDVMKKVCQHE